jgi:HSP20 family protein
MVIALNGPITYSTQTFTRRRKPSMPNTPVRYRPETSLTRLPDVIDQLFRDSFVMPTRFERFFDGKRAANLLETDADYIVQLVIPGVDPKGLQINVVGQQLTIKAVCTIPTTEHATYLYHGLFGEEFSDVFTLPAEVDGEKSEARYVNGVLTITLPKAENARPKVIKVATTF